VKFKTLFESQ